MNCQSVGNKAFLKKDYGVECYSDMWWHWWPVALLLFLGFALMLPFLLSMFLWKHRKTLHSASSRQTFGWLYNRLNRGSEFWEVHEVFRKLVFTGVLVYFDSTVRASIAIVVSALALCTLNYFKPKKNTGVLTLACFACAK